jgi:hypothetical protein
MPFVMPFGKYFTKVLVAQKGSLSLERDPSVYLGLNALIPLKNTSQAIRKILFQRNPFPMLLVGSLEE